MRISMLQMTQVYKKVLVYDNGCMGQLEYLQRSGDRENITVIVTICADGTSQAPAVVYKGEKYQASWAQDNPLNAS